MAGELIKVYNSKDNAIAGGTTGQVVVGTVASNGGAVYNSTKNVPYFIYREYWYRIEANGPLQGIYIDWDDGEDNSIERANLEFILPEVAGNVAITSHIYTKHGTFWPMIKALSLGGYQSKWYTNDANEGYKELEDLTYQTGNANVAAGRNDISIVREEKAASDKIPHFLPANRNPIAILKSDRKRIFAGIDNDGISGTSPLVYAYTTSAVSSRPKVHIEATAAENRGIREYLDVPVQTDTTVADGTWAASDIQNDTVPKGSDYTPAVKEKWRFAVGGVDYTDSSIGENEGYSDPDGNAPYIKIYNSSDTSSEYRVWWKHAAKKQIYRVQVSNVSIASFSGHYIKMDYPSAPAGEAPVYFWFDTTGSESEPAALSLINAKKKVDISGDSDARDVRNTLKDAIHAGFNFTNAQNTVSTMNAFEAANGDNDYKILVTCKVAGEVPSPGIERTGLNLTVGINSQGADIGESEGVVPSGSGFTSVPAALGTAGDNQSTIRDALVTAINGIGGTPFTATNPNIDTGDYRYLDIERNTAGATQDFAIVKPGSGSGYLVGNGNEPLTAGADALGAISNIGKVYKAKLSHIDRLNDTDRVYLMSHDFDATTGNENPQPETDYCIGVLSNGNPIIEINDPYTIATLDASESYARASNSNINTYSYDLDKQTVNALEDDLTSVNDTQTSDSVDVGMNIPLTPAFGIDDDGDYTALNYGNVERLQQSYTQHPTGNPLDSNSRFHNFYRLPRVQVEDDTITTLADATSPIAGDNYGYGGNSGDINRLSNITCWTRGKFDRDSGEINYLLLGAAGSFTKDATVTQASSGATGKVFRTTKNNKWLELYDITGTFNTTNTITSDNVKDVDASIVPSSVTVGDYRMLKEDWMTGRKHIAIATGSGRTNNHANNRTDSTANTSESVDINETEINVTSGSAFTVGDYIAFGVSKEVLKVTAINSNVLTVTRGEFATTPSAHITNQDIYKITPKWLNPTLSGTTNIILGGNSTFELATTDNLTDHPENFILTALPVKYDKLFFRFDNTLLNAVTTEPYINLTAHYTKATTTNNVTTYSWAPLPIIDKTQQWKQSGIIQWDIPDDWASVVPADLSWTLVGENGGNTYDPESKWDTDGYGIIIAATVQTPTINRDGKNVYINYGGGYSISGDNGAQVITGGAEYYYRRDPYEGPDGYGAGDNIPPNVALEVGDIIELFDEDIGNTGIPITVTALGASTITTSTNLTNGSSNQYQFRVVRDVHEHLKLYNVWPMIDEHTELVTVSDPHHVSLNDIAIAQSISYRRSGKYMVVEDRLGKADIRRIGASGGRITFGGLDLGTDATGRDKILSYQKNGTPVFLDVEHKDTDKTRFFGVISEMTEDYATGKMSPKWAITFICSHLIEFSGGTSSSTSGIMSTDKIALGGVVDDVAKYVL